MFTPAKRTSVIERRGSTASLTGLERARLERDHLVEVPGASVTPLPVAEAQTVDPVLDMPVKSAAPEAAPSAPQLAAGPQSAAVSQLAAAPSASGAASSAHLFAGPGITLKGEIAGCDTLKVEGMVDGNASARQLVICQGGRFLGTAEIEEAVIEGSFQGTLCVHGHLLLRGTGRIAGKVSYGEIEVERGGEIVGEITVHGKQLPQKPVMEPDRLRSVSNERRAAVAEPVESAPAEPVVEAPTHEVAERAGVVEYSRDEGLPAQTAQVEDTVIEAPAAPQTVTKPAAPQPVRSAPPAVSSFVAKPRKSLFFGRS